MRRILISIFVLFIYWLPAHDGNPVFVPNQGQWQQDFKFKTPMLNGDIYFHSDRVLFHLRDPNFMRTIHAHHKGYDESEVLKPDVSGNLTIKEHAYSLSWIGGNARPKVEADRALSYVHNYFLGKDPSKWRSKVPVYRRTVYRQIYPGIDMRWYGERSHLKYDFQLKAGVSPDLIRLKFEGVDSIQVIDNQLHIYTSLGKIVEQKPFAYQVIGGVYYEVPCKFIIANGALTFQVEKYDSNHPLTVDPTIVFSSFTGSASDNWGFTATYDNDGNLYAGGMVFGGNYPTNTGAYQSVYGGGNTDVSIFKFNADGSALLYSTFLGGNNSEQPHSMIVNSNNELVVFGTTSSLNFPTTSGAFQTTFGGGANFILPGYTFANGSDIFITKFNAAGSALVGSTFYGGSGNDGINLEILRNYGDYARGEVILDSLDNIYVASMTFSTNAPTNNPAFGANAGGSDALILKFNPTLTSLTWGTYYGGLDHDAAYSVRIKNNQVFVAGGARSPNLPVDSAGFQPTYQGNIDGFIARFNANSGAFEHGTYYGTGQYDQVFFIDTDRFGDLYAFGQTKGVIPMDANLYGQPAGKHFISKFTPDLQTRIWNTNIGNSNGDLVSPSAFEVDDCNAILFSAWGGVSNNPSPFFNNMVPEPNGTTNGLPVTPNAFQPTTDGSDFYFAALSSNASGLEFGTFYGGTANEHVDGGTSRFSPQGIIYQAVCAACGGGTGNTFPTTPGVFGPSRPPTTNCNKAGIKIDFDRSVEANANLDIAAEVDSLCNGFLVSFGNASNNANAYFWDFGNGVTSTDSAPTVLLVGPAVYTVMLVAMDTNCNLFDTVFLQVPVESFVNPVASITYNYSDCDPSLEVFFELDSTIADYIIWHFGDGTILRDDSLGNITHAYPVEGIFQGFMVAYDSICGQTDTTFFTINFIDIDFEFPEVDIFTEECKHGKAQGVVAFDALEPNRYILEWFFSDGVRSGFRVEMNFSEGGRQTVTLRITDTICNIEYEKDFEIEIETPIEEFRIPNTFTPNGDGRNDVLTITGDPCIEGARFFIYNRWGQLMFETDQPFQEFWNGNTENHPSAAGVYFYLYKNGDHEERGTVHLFR